MTREHGAQRGAGKKRPNHPERDRQMTRAKHERSGDPENAAAIRLFGRQRADSFVFHDRHRAVSAEARVNVSGKLVAPCVHVPDSSVPASFSVPMYDVTIPRVSIFTLCPLCKMMRGTVRLPSSRLTDWPSAVPLGWFAIVTARRRLLPLADKMPVHTPSSCLVTAGLVGGGSIVASPVRAMLNGNS